MNEYRCTRNEPYLNPNCFGHTDLEARQGFYIKADSEQVPLHKWLSYFPMTRLGLRSTCGGF